MCIACIDTTRLPVCACSDTGSPIRYWPGSSSGSSDIPCSSTLNRDSRFWIRFDGADWAGSCPLRSGRHDGDQPGLRMAKMKFHFLEDYRALVRDLIARYPLPEAMSRAVGGSYDALGEVEKQLLIGYGLLPTHTLIDVGCGAGRLAKALVPYLTEGRFLGTDV